MQIRRLRHVYVDLRAPRERSADNWFYAMLRYVANGILRIVAVGVAAFRAFCFIWRIGKAVCSIPIHVVAVVVSAVGRPLIWLWRRWIFRTLLALVVWPAVLLYCLR